MFDAAALRAALAAHGRIARVVIAGHEGSSPREAGAAMLVWTDGQSGTIGGGALEWQAAADARAALARDEAPPRRVERAALGPMLGQCCGGRVDLVTEIFTPDDDAILARLEGAAVVARPLDRMAAPLAGAATPEMPLALRRLFNRARAEGAEPPARIVQGWFVEPLRAPGRPLWIWGAGHVGRAIAAVLAPLPEFAITWVDCARSRFPDAIDGAVTPLWAENPADLVAPAPAGARHLIVTYSHALDLELCHRLLEAGATDIGLIGSATKWARFRGRLSRLGHAPARIAAIECPIGEKELGKHPQAIALGVATALLRRERKGNERKTGGSLS